MALLLSGPFVAYANNGSSSARAWASAQRIFIHGRVTNGSVIDGKHNFRVRVFSDDGLLHEEELQSEVRDGAYDVLLGSTEPLGFKIHPGLQVRVSIDGGDETLASDQFDQLMAESDFRVGRTLLDREQSGSDAILQKQLADQSNERVARYRSELGHRLHQIVALIDPYVPTTGFEVEMGVAPPATDIPNDAYQLAKYGRVNVEYKNIAEIDGNHVGLAARALHVAHHLLLYSAGISTDINNDGMFTLTAGLAHYQTGQKRFEPFVDAPFMRFKFRSSPTSIFAYSELETTMHERAYISAMVGLGMMVSPGVRFIAGFAHTEFVMPTEQMVQQINGLQGTFMWGVR